MDINITSAATQQAKCSQLDRLAHDYCGVKTQQTLTDDDPTAGCRKGYATDFNGATINVSEGIYSDVKEAVEQDFNCTINATAVCKRILDDAVRKVLATSLEGDETAKVTLSKFNAMTTLPSFQSNTDIQSFKELADSNVTSLPAGGCFQNCSNLKEISFPSTLHTIPYYTFWSAGFKSFTIPTTITTIGSDVFRQCSSLTTINYEGTVAQCRAISWGVRVLMNAGTKVVHCTDGDVKFDSNGTIIDE